MTKDVFLEDVFLDPKYEVPEPPSNYYKFEQGENRFRIMSSPILGRVWWTREDGTIKFKGEQTKKGDKPVRIRMDDNITPDQFEAAKHFWAMIIYDYKTESAKILEITQSTIQKPLRALAKDKDWGNPRGTNGYDIVISKKGEKLETEYQVMPKPRKKLESGIEQMVKDLNINLEALFENGDPFAKDLANDAEKAGV